MLPLRPDIIGIVDFFFFQIQHNNTESAGEIGIIPDKGYAVNGLVSQYGFPLDVGNVDDGIILQKVNICIGISNNKRFQIPVIVYRADADIGESIYFGKVLNTIISFIIIKDSIRGSAIYSRFILGNGNTLIIGKFIPPFSG